MGNHVITIRHKAARRGGRPARGAEAASPPIPPHKGKGRKVPPANGAPTRAKASAPANGAPQSNGAAPFWRVKRLSEMSVAEWESLCDGCGRCCLNKLTDIDTGQTVFTDVGCTLLDDARCRCTDYARRQSKVSDCVRLTWRNVSRLTWLPPTCAYRLVAKGQDLPWWHPLVSGDADTVHAAGVSVRGRVSANERDVPDEKMEDYVVAWPGRWPKGARRRKR